MIVAEYFPEDNMKVAWYQHDVYGPALWIIKKMVIEDYLEHSYKVGLFDEVTNFLEILRGFDHRPFQYFHDLIAAYYRYLFCRQYVLPFEGFVNPQNGQEWQEHWLDFLRSEMDKLLDLGYEFDLASLFLLYDTDYGYVLEDRLLLKLADRYLEETRNVDGKGVDFLDQKLRRELIKSLKDKPTLDRNGVLELVRENKDLIGKRISGSRN